MKYIVHLDYSQDLDAAVRFRECAYTNPASGGIAMYDMLNNFKGSVQQSAVVYHGDDKKKALNTQVVAQTLLNDCIAAQERAKAEFETRIQQLKDSQ